MKPRFVVLIPVRNAEKWIERSIKSVLDQDYESSRILLIDDASTDETYLHAYGLRDEEYLRLKVLTCMLPAI